MINMNQIRYWQKYTERRNGRFYIKMGYAGYNTPANNRNGYKTADGAIEAIRRRDPQMKNYLEEPHFSKID